jgi:hypothetical protein
MKTIRVICACLLMECIPLFLISCKPPDFNQRIQCADGFQRNDVDVRASAVYPGDLLVTWKGPHYDPAHWRQTTEGRWQPSEGCVIDTAP